MEKQLSLHVKSQTKLTSGLIKSGCRCQYYKIFKRCSRIFISLDLKNTSKTRFNKYKPQWKRMINLRIVTLRNYAH